MADVVVQGLYFETHCPAPSPVPDRYENLFKITFLPEIYHIAGNQLDGFSPHARVCWIIQLQVRLMETYVALFGESVTIP